MPVHFAVEERAEQPPDFLGWDWLPADFVANGMRKIVADQFERDVLSLVEPLPERHNHVQQHFIAVADDQGPSHNGDIIESGFRERRQAAPG